VVNVSQCITGSVDQEKYKTGHHLAEVGVLGGEDLSFEAAICKLMYLLACDELSLEERKKYMLENLRGEMGNRNS